LKRNPIFVRTQWRLAGWYALAIGLLLSLCGFGLYQAVLHTQRYILRQKLESLAGTLHDTIEPVLEQPGKLNSQVTLMLPGLCFPGEVCQTLAKSIENASGRHIAGVFQQQGYYVRFVDRANQVIATIGQQPIFSGSLVASEYWQQLSGVKDDSNFYQISMPLRTRSNIPWGYVQVGRSLQEWDAYLYLLRLLLLLGVPFAIFLVTGASWWLAGLAMRPIDLSYRQMQQFTSDAAHELRTPLTVLYSALEETKLAEELPEIHQNLDIMERQIGRLSQLVKDLLLICRLEQRPSLQLNPCNLSDVLTDLVEELEGMSVNASVTLKLDLRTQAPTVILGDSAQLYRMVSNLITNAIHYTPMGGTVLAILDRTPDEALIHIQDTGIGIPSSEQNRIFDRFYRVQSDRARTTGGSGLGLAIAQAIAQTHQGRIGVQSELTKGSVFTVRLPLIYTQ